MIQRLSIQLPIVIVCDLAPQGEIGSVDVNGDCPYCGERVAAHDFEPVKVEPLDGRPDGRHR